MRNILQIAGATDKGKVRENNEDAFLMEPSLGLFIVADGMGGHNSGEVASQMAVAVVADCARREKPKGGVPQEKKLSSWIENANAAIYRHGQNFPKDAGLGTTIVAVLTDGASLAAAHVGDSRLYRWRDGKLDQLTRDHSLVEEQVRSGRLTRREADSSSFQNILTRALGVQSDVEVDTALHELRAGDCLLLVTDGLTKMVDEESCRGIIEREKQPQKIVESLIAAANAAGGVDNVTVIAAKVEAGGWKNSLPGFVSQVLGA